RSPDRAPARPPSGELPSADRCEAGAVVRSLRASPGLRPPERAADRQPRRHPAGRRLMARLLLVEDRESLRRMLERALTGEGHSVRVADDLPAALDELQGEPLDLVLTDLQLPGGTGLEVLRAARRLQPQAAVVVLTAFGTVARAVEAMKAGAADFLEKPVDLDALFGLVRALTPGQAGSAAAVAPVFEPPGAPPIVGAHPRLKA